MSTEAAEGDKTILLPSAQTCCQFSLAEIQKATKDFDDKLTIGQGGFGKVYKGRIYIEETNQVVAIKRLNSMSNQGADEFRAEIHMLSKLRHSHLVTLLGFCDDNNEMVLIYEYMPNGTLYDRLHKAENPLNWMQRLKIAIGAGSGLDYLHTGGGIQQAVIHRDIKSSNILLDKDMAARISDFGLSKMGSINQSVSYVETSVKGTFGYLDPEYFYTRKLTRKTDVYAFGVVLFELLSGRLAVDERYGEEHCSLVRWAQKCVKERKFNQMVDINIRGTISPKCLRGFAQIANRCLHSVLKERPTMADVVVSLQALLNLQQRHDNPAEPSGITRFTFKIHKYLVPTTKQITDQSSTSSSKISENQSSTSSSKIPENNMNNDQDLKCFKYHELRLATDNFQTRKYSSGNSYEVVYAGWINKTTYSPSENSTRLPVTVKIFDFYKPVVMLDLKLFKEFNHPNLVELIGYCLEGKQVFFVYELMPNGNFEDLLTSGGAARLPLVTKVKIAVGIARGIVFLHKTQNKVGADYPWDAPVSDSPLARHRILLDGDFTAKLSDYNISKLMHGGYPRNILELIDLDFTCHYYPGCGPFQPQTNLLGFSVLFTELLTGKQIYKLNEFEEIGGLIIHDDNISMSLVDVAQKCFEICNEVDSELTMLGILEKYIAACRNSQQKILKNL